MKCLKVRDKFLDVNYREELEPYLYKFDKIQERGNKIQACSPFRNEYHPSFAVNIDNGSWVDSGADDEKQRKGNFIILLSFLRNETYEETSDYLTEKYIQFLNDTDKLTLNLNLQMEVPKVSVLSVDEYESVINLPSGYLTGRGITLKVQAYFQTGIGKNADCITLPWHDINGRIINIKYRSIENKSFWYSKDGQPVKKHVYGLFAIRESNIKEVWCVESEIDALYLWSLGIPSIAFGGASFNDIQKDLILNSGIETLIIATDNDVVGNRFAAVLYEEFGGNFNCYRIGFPPNIKDVNEMTPEQIVNAKINASKFTLFRQLAVKI